MRPEEWRKVYADPEEERKAAERRLLTELETLRSMELLSSEFDSLPGDGKAPVRRLVKMGTRLQLSGEGLLEYPIKAAAPGAPTSCFRSFNFVQDGKPHAAHADDP